MKPRCDGNRPGVCLSGFICCLDEGHDGRCKPYQPPTVDEWRARNAAEAELERGLREALAYECGRANMLENAAADRERAARRQGWHDGFKAGLARPVDGASDGDGFDLDAHVIAGVQRDRQG